MVEPELVNILSSFKDELKSEMSSFKDEVNARFDAVEERLSLVENTCTVMQYEHGKKLETIFDYIKEDLEKHENYENRFNQVDSKLADYSIRLSIVESTGAYKSALDLMKKENLDKDT